MLKTRAFIFGLAFLLAVALGAGCREGSDSVVPTPDPEPNLTMLALGDSYTVGESIRERWSWPNQLADSLASAGTPLDNLTVIAQTGWTTRDLLDATRDSLAQGKLQPGPYGLVTLMIGVNNQFQGLSGRLFEAELDTLIMLARELTGDDPARVLGFSIPNYGVTPIGELFGRERIGREIQSFNGILARKFGEYGIVMIDVTPLSLLVESEPQLLAGDGLHYSWEMYGRWVALMLPAVRTCLGL